nr:uncharacterized protein LOC115259391 [Aedes albopictus]
MGRNYHCTDQQRKWIKQQAMAGKSQREIAGILGRSKTFVFNAINTDKTRVSSGRPRKTTSKDDGHIKRLSNIDSFKSATKIRDELDLSVSTRTVQRRLVEKQLIGRSPRKVPMLTRKHLQARIKFAMNHLDWVGPENGKKMADWF